MKKKDLVEQVVATSGLKKREARKAVDATLAAIRTSLLAGTDVTLPPLGRIKVKKNGEGETAKTNYKLMLASEAEAAAADSDAETDTEIEDAEEANS